MFTCEIEGCPIVIYVSDHAAIRMKQRRVNKYAAFGSIIAVGEDLLDMKHGDEFAVVDKEVGITVICGIHACGLDISIEIITVLDNDDVYVKKGTRIYNIGQDKEVI